MLIGNRISAMAGGGDIPPEPTPEYWGLYFEAESPNVVVNMTTTGSAPTVSLETSTDGETWTTFDADGGTTPVTLASIGDRVYFRAGTGGNTQFSSADSNYHTFTLSGACGAHGNIMSLLDGDDDTNVTLSAGNCFFRLFGSCTTLTTAPMLPATTLSWKCYGFMFEYCRSLLAAPVLPATTLVGRCYQAMFQQCVSLASMEVAFSSWPADTFTDNWVYGVASTGTFTCPTALGTNETIARGQRKCPSGWTVVNT